MWGNPGVLLREYTVTVLNQERCSYSRFNTGADSYKTNSYGFFLGKNQKQVKLQVHVRVMLVKFLCLSVQESSWSWYYQVVSDLPSRSSGWRADR